MRFGASTRNRVVVIAVTLSVPQVAAPQMLTQWSTSIAAGVGMRVDPAPSIMSPSGGASLHVEGGTAGGVWYHVSAPSVPVVQGDRYRLSAWLRVDSVGAGTPAPYLKCEFLDTSGRSVGRANSLPYRLAQGGTWQLLGVEFRVPFGATTCYAALQKGVSAPTQIDAYLADGRLESLAGAVSQPPVIPSTPALLVRPRLHLGPSDFASIRAAIGSTHAAVWADVRALADRLVSQPPPVYQTPVVPDDEQLWQRLVGNAMPTLAMAYRFSGDARYLQAASAYAAAAISYPTWGCGRNDGTALAAGHLLSGLSILYDWLNAEIDPALRASVRSTLASRGAQLFEYENSGQSGGEPLLTNTQWVRVSALATVGYALMGEEPAAPWWIDRAARYFERVLGSLGPDGASFEGVGYWAYAIEFLLRYLDLTRKLGGRDLYDVAWLRQAASYRQYMSLPQNAWAMTNVVVDLADAERENWYGPAYTLRGLAGRFRDSHAQWLAAALDARKLSKDESLWLNLVWLDPTLTAAAPADLPTLRHFTDMGLVSARSDWSGNESLVVFKSGPFAGHYARDVLAYDPGSYHVHPDANHFVLFGGGEWLIRDDGYGAKSTAQHNTLLVDGQGQLGEGMTWYDPVPALAARSAPRILGALSTPMLDWVSGEAASAYPQALGVQKASRQLLFLKPDVLIVLDDVQASAQRLLELRFHLESAGAQQAGGVVIAQGQRTILRVAPLTLANVTETYAEETALDPRQGVDGRLRTLRLAKSASSWRNAVAFSWGSTPPVVTLSAGSSLWQFRVSGRNVDYEWSTGRVCAYRDGQPPSCLQSLGAPGAPVLIPSP